MRGERRKSLTNDVSTWAKFPTIDTIGNYSTFSSPSKWAGMYELDRLPLTWLVRSAGGQRSPRRPHGNQGNLAFDTRSAFSEETGWTFGVERRVSIATYNVLLKKWCLVNITHVSLTFSFWECVLSRYFACSPMQKLIFLSYGESFNCILTFFPLHLYIITRPCA